MSDSGEAKSRLEWALRYARLGWPVFPLAPGSKMPLISGEQGGHGCLDASLSENQIRTWWGREPRANIGVATGHRFFVLDKDLKKGGEESLDYLIHQHGPLPDTIQQVTGTGGSHYLFQLPDFPVRNSDSKLAPGIDIRGFHGYIVAAPSIHPETKRAYFWDGLALIEEQKVAVAPGWLQAWLRKQVDGERPDRPAAAPPIAAKLTAGHRHNTLVSIAGSMRRRGLASDEIDPVLQAVNQVRCEPPYDAAHVRKIAESMDKYPPDARYNVFAQAAGPAPAEPPPGDGRDEIPLTLADVEAAVDEAIGRNDLVAITRLIPEIAKLRAMFQPVILAKLRAHFKKDFPAKEFEKALKDAARDLRKDDAPENGAGGNPPPEAPAGAGDVDGPDLRWDPQTEAGNGERIVRLFGTEVRYCVEMKQWLVWDGKRWAVDTTHTMRQRAKRMARRLFEQAIGVGALLEKWARTSESYAATTAALGYAATEPGIPISVAELDQQPYLLNCPNGVVDLKTGALLPHNREFLITKLCPVAYDPQAQCPRFLAFVEWAMGANPDADLSERTTRLVGFMQRAFGLALTTDVSEKAVFIFYGEGGNNGKTTLLELFRELMGKDYASQLIIDTVMTMKSQDATTRADLADLRGARFVSTSEVSKEQKLDEAKIKYITAGMATIKTCRKWENPIEFPATHKLFMDCNYRPRIRGADDAIWRRLKLIPFNVTISEAEKDLQLAQKLRLELPGVLAWAVRGCQAWLKNGLGDPPEVAEAGETWREHDDPLKEFLEDCCETTEGAFVRGSDLAAGYEWWARQNRERFPLGREAFTERLISKGFKQGRSRRIDGKQARTWEGVQLTQEVVTAIRRTPTMGGRFEDE